MLRRKLKPVIIPLLSLLALLCIVCNLSGKTAFERELAVEEGLPTQHDTAPLSHRCGLEVGKRFEVQITQESYSDHRLDGAVYYGTMTVTRQQSNRWRGLVEFSRVVHRGSLSWPCVAFVDGHIDPQGEIRFSFTEKVHNPRVGPRLLLGIPFVGRVAGEAIEGQVLPKRGHGTFRLIPA